jgi:hypothetical protein
VIVGKYFEGDDDTEIAWKQHDVYGQALGAIIQTCNGLTLFAKALFHPETHSEWGTIESCDHRTLQAAHDILAATWRFRHDMRQAEFPLEKRPEPLVPHTPDNLWLWWLRGEIESWVWHPQLVRDVQLILTNQNQPIGYASESRLCLALLDRFPDVPWLSSKREALEKDLENDLNKVTEPAPEPMRRSRKPAALPCECTAKGRPACNMIPCKTTAARAAREGWGPLE